MTTSTTSDSRDRSPARRMVRTNIFEFGMVAVLVLPALLFLLLAPAGSGFTYLHFLAMVSIGGGVAFLGAALLTRAGNRHSEG